MNFTNQVGRDTGEERSEALLLLEKLKKQEEGLKKDLQKYRDCDPDYIAQLKAEIQVKYF